MTGRPKGMRKCEKQAGQILMQTEVKIIEIIRWQLLQAIMLYSWFKKKLPQM
jgi:hypothetical protein